MRVFVSLVVGLASCIVFSNQTFATTLPNGDFISESISTAGEVDVHNFTANAGDSVYLRVADTETTEFINSAFRPRVELYDPTGSFLAGGEGALVGSVFRALVLTGTYEVRVFDDSSAGNETGTYDLHFARMPGANEGGTLPNGGSVSGQIDLGDIDTYTFTANAGDSVYASLADTETTEFINSAFRPRIELFGPNGSYLTGGEGALVGRLFRALTVSGSYTIVAYDDSSGLDEVGSYDLYFAKMAGADEGGSLPNGGFVSDQIDLGDLDTYTFTAVAGESVYVSVADTETTEFINSSFRPRVELYAPNGSYLTGSEGALVGRLFRALSVSGTYTVITYDDSSGLDSTGTYDLQYSKAVGANDGNGISGGDTKLEFIDLGDIDTYAFTPTILGANALFTITDLDGTSFRPRIEVFGPNGAYISGSEGATSAQVSVNMNVAGQYTLFVYDDSSGASAIGNYQLQGVGNFVGVGAPPALCNGLPVTVDLALGDVPTSGDDVILGTSGADVILGMGGNDTICGLAGNDDINGGRDEDWIDAGPGDDIVLGGNDADEIYGDSGDDDLFGGPGNDVIAGEAGDDFLKGNSGNDDLSGNEGVDKISGGSGNDVIDTGTGSNVGTAQTVTGGNGNDTIYGGADADELRGEAGEDTIRGGGGNDRLFGGGGEDDVNGQAGDDLVRGNAADDILNGGSGNDTVDGLGGKDLMYGGEGADVMSGSTGNDTMYGQTGDDTLNGGGGNDSLNGDGGIDDCDGAGGTGDTATSCETQTNIP